ncbi:M35 family metallo-endopeptidase [Sediminicoccus sp. KRV36]|uniref:M35 family metallopeptidase n=1 Tax=Sediminicoccus sp. KRV36 TaxID=3133721 RepID=UPI00200FB6DD|nr:M35 family metallo-endopeptidase [Sediminicoccus rosea]UPY36935.1 hypothetical protein LHU95_22395 [Sediminicoccus rosea]
MAFALLLAIGPGWAKGPEPGPTSCDAKQNILVQNAFVLAEQRARAALAFLDADPYHAHIRTWFGSAPVPKVRARLAQTLELLRPERRPTYLCGTAASCGNRPIYAIANLVRRTVNLCPMFFNARNEGADSRPGILVHEMSHLAAGTADMAYGPTAAMALARKEPDRAALNADNYEYFVEFLPGLSASRPATR